MKCKKISTEGKPQYGMKYWVNLKFIGEDSEWSPSLFELLELYRQIARCEDKSYPYGEGRHKFLNFLCDGINDMRLSYETLAKKYQIPSRHQTQWLELECIEERGG